ncbi:hypothetical protein BGX23_011230 [Mortierella sp. AD031]|nr:hypothetical protein BGX23_011230 [Mortierella sp. AD031]
MFTNSRVPLDRPDRWMAISPMDAILRNMNATADIFAAAELETMAMHQSATTVLSMTRIGSRMSMCPAITRDGPLSEQYNIPTKKQWQWTLHGYNTQSNRHIHGHVLRAGFDDTELETTSRSRGDPVSAPCVISCSSSSNTKRSKTKYHTNHRGYNQRRFREDS